MRTLACETLAAARMCTTSPDMFDANDLLTRYERLKAAVADTRFGTDAYAYAMVASGHTDLVAESGMQPYDYLSHAVIVAGAGGVVTGLGRAAPADRFQRIGACRRGYGGPRCGP